MYLFRLDNDQNVLDFALIDFQILMINSVAIDVQYLLSSTANMPELVKNKQKWLELYHDALIKSLTKFGYNESIYSFQDFLEDMKSASFHFLISGFIHTQVRLLVSFYYCKNSLISNHLNRFFLSETAWTMS